MEIFAFHNLINFFFTIVFFSVRASFYLRFPFDIVLLTFWNVFNFIFFLSIE